MHSLSACRRTHVGFAAPASSAASIFSSGALPVGWSPANSSIARSPPVWEDTAASLTRPTRTRLPASWSSS
eukprot:7079891-Alexandrium_andersonii.AAC.1